MSRDKKPPPERRQTILKEGERLTYEPYGNDPTRRKVIFENAEGKRVVHVVSVFPTSLLEELERLDEEEPSEQVAVAR